MDTTSPDGRIQLLGLNGRDPAVVELRRGDEQVASEVVSGDDAFAAVAEATSRCIEQLLPAAAELSLEQVHVLSGPRPVVVVVIVLTIGGVRMPHVGSALVRGDDDLSAVARATLAAVNRRLEIMET